MRSLLIFFILSSVIAMGQVTSFDGQLINIQDTGEGDTTLLLVHGWNLDHTFWKHQAEAFSSRYRVVIPDLPGYGASGKTRGQWSMKSYGKDIISIIRQLNLRNVVLVGHSMGGNIILEAYSEDPANMIGLIGVDNFKDVGAVPDAETADQMQAFYAMLEENYPVNVRLASEGFMFDVNSPAGPKAEVLDAYAAADPSIAIPVVRAAFTESLKEAEQLENVKVPFALISSVYIPFNESMFLDHYNGPFFRNYDMKNTGHFPMYEDPETFNGHLETALSEMFVSR